MLQRYKTPLQIKWNEKFYTLPKSTHKIMYNIFLSRKAESSEITKKLFQELNVTDEKEIKDMYLLSQRTEVRNPIKELQYKILNKYVAVNTFLKKIKIVKSALCSFGCGKEETVNHLFFKCDYIQDFWTSFSTYLENKTKQTIYFDLKTKYNFRYERQEL